MSGAFPVSRQREFDYELRETEPQRRRRARLLRAMYALVDPHGWDARRHFSGAQVAAALATLGHEFVPNIPKEQHRDLTPAEIARAGFLQGVERRRQAVRHEA